MTRLSQLLFIIRVTMVIVPATHEYIYYLLGSYITYIQHTGYLFLDAFNPLHAVYGL